MIFSGACYPFYLSLVFFVAEEQPRDSVAVSVRDASTEIRRRPQEFAVSFGFDSRYVRIAAGG